MQLLSGEESVTELTPISKENKILPEWTREIRNVWECKYHSHIQLCNILILTATQKWSYAGFLFFLFFYFYGGEGCNFKAFCQFYSVKFWFLSASWPQCNLDFKLSCRFLRHVPYCNLFPHCTILSTSDTSIPFPEWLTGRYSTFVWLLWSRVCTFGGYSRW